MQYLLYFISIPFLYFNYKIVTSDLKNKIIPNKYLLYLLLLIPFYYIYIFFSFPEINYLLFLGQIFLTFIISFILYYFGIWAAGDAKYLLILSLFIPYIGIVPYIGNISLLTLGYLFLYFIYFYLGKLLFNKNYRKDLLINVKQDLLEKWNTYKNNRGGRTFFIILRWLVIFLIIFVSIRLGRIYLINSFLENGNNINLFSEIIQKYNIYLIFLFIGLFIGGLYILRILINKFKNYISRNFKIKLETVGNIFIIILAISLTSFIVYEYSINSKEITNFLFRIFTLYLGIYIFVKIMLYSYKITFGIAETNYININDLKKNDIVDKPYLAQMFGEQYILGYYENGFDNYYKKGILFPSPKKYFANIDNPIDQKTINKLKKIYKITNEYQKNKNKDHNNIESIKILNTFSFGPYLFLGFLITFILQDQIFKTILGFITNLIKTFIYHY